MREEILRMEHVYKSFSDINVLSDFKLSIYKGEILGLVGLRHSGKTLITNIIAGLEKVDSGFIYFEEEGVDISSERKSRELGIFCIHNQMQVIPQLSVAENIFVVRDDKINGIFLDKKLINKKTEKVLSEMGLGISPETKVSDLTTAQQHLLEIAKAVAEDAKLILIDDIIDSYTENEIKSFVNVISSLKQKGVSILFAARKPENITDFIDRIIILRDGRNIKTLYRDEYNIKLIYSLLVGYKFVDRSGKLDRTIGSEILRVKNLSTDILKNNISFTLRKGEILGVFDIENKSNIELARTLCGIKKFEGNIFLDNQKVVFEDIHQAIKNGIGIIPQEGIKRSLIGDMDVLNNLIFLVLKKISNNILTINKRMLEFIINEYIDQLEIESKDIDKPINYFDIYTKEKILLYKWLLYKPKVLILINPTDKADVIAKNIFLEFINKYLEKGISLIIVSSNFTEVSSICDKVILLKDYSFINEYNQSEIQNISFNKLY